MWTFSGKSWQCSVPGGRNCWCGKWVQPHILGRGCKLAGVVSRAQRRHGVLFRAPAFKRIATGTPATVPVGRYTKDALGNAKLWEAVQAALIQGNSVRQVLDYVARGEVDAGFVYATDAKQMADKVDVVMVVGGHEPVTYPIAVALTGSNPKMGQAFIDFVLSPEGQAVLARYGFSKP